MPALERIRANLHRPFGNHQLRHLVAANTKHRTRRERICPVIGKAKRQPIRYTCRARTSLTVAAARADMNTQLQTTAVFIALMANFAADI